MSTKSTTIILSDELTWPSVVLDCLNKHHDIFYLGEDILEGVKQEVLPARQYDFAHEELYKALLPFHLKGYHCTRLTESEILNITNDGTILPNLDFLTRRIDTLVSCGILTSEIANRLKTENEASCRYRIRQLWFCFFPPKKDGDGVKRFFCSWGGEALYMRHENDPETGAILREIGKPCIVEADIPISSLNPDCGLTFNIARNFLKNNGRQTNECYDFSAYSKKNILPSQIKKIFQFPDPDFIALSGWGSL